MLHVEKIFKVGKQGITGLTDKGDTFKVSQHINYLTEHEYFIMDRLKALQDFCPNFCLPIKLLQVPVEPKPEKKNPFLLKSKYPIQQNVLFEQYIKGNKLCKHLNRGDNNIVLSSIKQILSAIAFSHELKFSHYDLHSDNIILEPCDADDVYFYIFEKDNFMLVPTHGYTARIIDYGFSYIDTMKDKYFTGSFAYTNIGFLGDRFDWVADPKLFLVTIFNEIKSVNEKNVQGKLLEIITKNIFDPLKIDWECGWDDVNKLSAIDIVVSLLENCSTSSRIFSRNEDYCLDIISSLMVLPITDKPIEELEESYEIFSNEFSKIEAHVKSSLYNLYILKCMVDSAKKCREDYYNDETREKALATFRADISESIMAVSKFCSPRNIQYELMLCALYNFSNCMEGVIYKTMNRTVKHKAKEYKKLPVGNIYDILNIININIPETYVYNKNSKIHVLNSVDKRRYQIELTSDMIEKLNSTPNYLHPFLLSEFC